jgi:hypothetical protein
VDFLNLKNDTEIVVDNTIKINTPKITPHKKIKRMERNSPSEETTEMMYDEDLPSGYYIYAEPPSTIFHFCNHMISNDFLTAYGDQIDVNFVYRSNACVYDDAGVPKTTFTKNTDVCLINEELLIVGAVMQFKSYYGFDVQYDLAMYQAMLDSIKTQNERTIITSTSKKLYTSKAK